MSKITTSFVVEAYETDPLTVDSIEVSAKFLSPAGCRSLLTGSINLSYSIELFIVYERFW